MCRVGMHPESGWASVASSPESFEAVQFLEVSLSNVLAPLLLSKGVGVFDMERGLFLGEVVCSSSVSSVSDERTLQGDGV